MNYFPVKSKLLTQTDSSKVKQTYVYISFDSIRLLDKIEFEFTGTPYFQRNGTLYSRAEKLNKKGVSEPNRQRLAHVQLTSTGKNAIPLPGIKLKDVVLVIENDDNPPLRVAEARGYQLSRYLLSYLKANQQYTLRFGDDTFNQPVYDLASFRKSIPSETQIVNTGSITLITRNEAELTADSGFTNSAIIWIAILLVVILLMIMSIRLVRDASSGTKEN